jgi:cobalamin biosynthesis protein CobT
MRNRYVKKCACDSNPVVLKKTVKLRKEVLDIEITVSCPECGRLYKEVVAKRTHMENPDILLETGYDELLIDSDNTGAEDESNGSGELQQEAENTEGNRQEEKSSDTAPEEKTEKAEPKDPERDSDESSEKGPVEKEEAPKRRRPPGKAARDKDINKPVYEKTTEEALKDSGVPKADLF